jgi:glutathione S-transferase
MESTSIAQKLEFTCPTPSLHLNDSLERKAQEISNQIIFPMAAFLFNRIYSQIVTEPEMEWFRTDRESRVSKMLSRDHITLEEWEREAGGKATFEASEPGMAELSKFLKEHKQDDGPFVLGSEACYADLMIAALAEFYLRVGDGAFEKLTESVDGLKELCEACSPWFRRNNH